MIKNKPEKKSSSLVFVPNSEILYRKISSFFLFLLTAGFLAYNEGIARQLIPPLLGGFFGVVSVASLVILGAPSAGKLFSAANSKSIYAKVLVALFAWLFSVTIYNWVSGDSLDAVKQSVEMLILWFSMFSIGLFVLPTKTLMRAISLVLLASFALIVLYYFNTGSLMYVARQLSTEIDIHVSSYQSYARSLSVLLLFSMALSLRQPGRLLAISFASLFILFLTAARSEFAGIGIVSSILIILQLFKFDKKGVRLNLVSICVLLSFVSGIFAAYTLSKQGESRIFQLLNISDSTSYLSRGELFWIGVEHIDANPIFGVFGGHVSDTGSVGGYIHNILSAWAGFGLPAFASMLYLQLGATFNGFKLFQRTRSDLCGLAFVVNLFCTILLLTSKSMFWVLPPLGWGLYLQAVLTMPKSMSPE